ncbi:hypothetical protein N9D31_00220 [Oligoflexaceae bacterium]|nr:hypothetical protein [Oligoflexaceae bacterium]
MSLFKSLSLFFLLLSSALVSSAIIADEAISPLEKNYVSDSDWIVESQLLTGFGQFQDMQTPYSLDEQMHIDGSEAFSQSEKQAGLIFGAELEVLSNDDDIKWMNRIHVMRMSNLSVATNYTDSSFSRLSFETGILFDQAVPFVNWNLALLAGYQRAFYSNTSSGHRLSSLYPKLEVSGSFSENWSAKASVRYGLQQQLHYDGGDGAKLLKNSQSSVVASDIETSYAISDTSALSFGLAFEQADILITDIDSYRDVGLDLLSLDDQEKKFNLSTVSCTIGVLTLW